MRDDPVFGLRVIVGTLEIQYGVRVAEIEFLPVAHDMNAHVHKVVADDGGVYFLKIHAEIDPGVLNSYRYKRIIDDLGEFGRPVFLTENACETSRDHDAALRRGLFEPGGEINRAEAVSRSRWLDAGQAGKFIAQTRI